MGASSGRNARILVDRGADEHVCPTDFASATLLGPTKGSILYDAQVHVIEAHGTRTVHMRLGPEGQSGCRIQRQKREITDPQHGEVGQTRLQVRDRLCARCEKGIAVWRWKL